MATKQILIELDEELYDTTALLAEASRGTSLEVYIAEVIAYANRVRMGLPETKQQIKRWQEKTTNTVNRTINACERQAKYENDKRASTGDNQER